jgi:penicillin-binding protein 2
MWQGERSRRLTIFGGIITAIIGLLILRLAWMQLWHGPQYKKQADENRVRQRVEYAPRGEIKDRNGAVMVSSRPSFAVSIIPAEFTNRAAASEILVAAIGIAPEFITTKLKEGEKFPFTPVRLKHDLEATVLQRLKSASAICLESSSSQLPCVTMSMGN